MSNEKSAEWYNKEYKKDPEYFKAPEDSRYYDLWLEAINWMEKSDFVIDFGCGTGQFEQLLYKRRMLFVRCYDFSSTAIEIAREANPIFKSRFVVQDLLNLNLNINDPPLYDVVVCFEVLEHIENDFMVISKVKKGKRFIFSVPNFYSPSHVRIFDIQKIEKRYGKILYIKQIKPFQLDEKHTIYLVDSIIK